MKKLFFATISALALAGVVNAADSTEFGAMQVVSPNTRTLVAIPWDNTKAGGGDIAVSNLVLTANLTAGDTLDVLKSDNKSFNRWTLVNNGGVLYWGDPVMVDEGGNKTETPADTATIKRGASVILIRQNPLWKSTDQEVIDEKATAGAAKPFYVMGQVAINSAEFQITAGTKDAPIHYLIASPSTTAKTVNEAVNWSEVASSISTDDVIVVPGANGFSIKLSFDKTQSKWGYMAPKMHEFLPIQIGTEWKEYSEVIPLGCGIWYVSYGGNPLIKWN